MKKKQMKIETERSIEMTKERQLVSINIREENGKQTVSARELHEKLDIESKFMDWFNRMLKYGFEENVDYISVSQKKETAQGNISTFNEYYISIDMAKEICMIQRSDKGRMFRQYFIECERRLVETNKKAMPQTYIEAVESLLNELKKNQALEEQGKLLLEQKEEAEKETERIYQCNKNFHNNLYTASQIAKKLGITANMVGRIANEHGLKQDPIYGKLGKIQLNNGQWVNQFYYNDDALTVMEAVIG